MSKEARFTDDAIFIVGAGRSGTTLLQMALNAHPKLSVTGEFHYFDQICRLKEEIPSLQNEQDLERFLLRVRNAYGFQYIPDVDALLEASGRNLLTLPPRERTYGRFFYELLEQHKKKSNASWVGEKTPENARYLSELKTLFPNSKIIHIVRDPRAVVASSIKMPENSKDILIHTATWRSDVWSAADFCQKNSNCYTIRYEDLVTNTRFELESLANFIGVPFDESMLAYQGIAAKMLKDEPWKNGTTEKVYGSSVDKWKKELSPDQIAVIELLTSPFMKKYDYTPSNTLWRKILALRIVPAEAIKYLARRKQKKQLEQESEVIFMATDRVITGLWKSLNPFI